MMRNSTESPMATKKVSSLIVTLAVPSIVAQIVNILYNIVDRMYVGHMPGDGAIALTALGVCAPLLLIVSAFALLIGGGGAPLAAMALGRGQPEDAGKNLGTGFATLTVLGVVLTVMGLLFLEPLLYVFGASPETLPYAMDYASTYLLGTIFVMYSTGLNPFISSQGKAKTAMITVVIGAVTNIVLDPVFIYALDMGVRGAAIATVLSQALSAVFVVRFLTSDKSILRIRKSELRIDTKRLGLILSIGVSSFIIQSTESAIQIAFNNRLLLYGGNLHIGAITILQSLMQLIIIPISGYTAGVQPLISFSYGAKRYERILEAVKISVIALTAVSMSYYLLIFFFPGLFARIFTTDPALLGLVEELLPIFMLGSSIFSIQMCAQMLYIGTGQARVSLFIAILRKVILLIPFTFVLPIFFGANGVIYAEPLADILSVCVSGTLLWIGVKNLRAGKEVFR